MDQKCDRLYPSAPLLEKGDSEQRLGKKLNEINITISTTLKMITYFKDKSNKSKKYLKNKKH